MAKNVTKSPAPMMAMEMDVKNMEKEAQSKNMVRGAAYDAPMINNEKRAAQKHIGNVPRANGQGLS